MNKKEVLIELCKDLRLPIVRRMIQSSNAFLNEEIAFEVLYKVLTQEKSDQAVRAKQNRIRAPNFPQKKLLDELILESLPEQAQNKLPELKSLDFIKNGQNVILTGPPGTGKTHISIGLGMEACLSGYRVFFATVPSFINQ